MKVRAKVCIICLILFLGMLLVNKAMQLLNVPSDYAVLAGVIILLLIMVFVPYLVFIVATFQEKKSEEAHVSCNVAHHDSNDSMHVEDGGTGVRGDRS